MLLQCKRMKEFSINIYMESANYVKTVHDINVRELHIYKKSCRRLECFMIQPQNMLQYLYITKSTREQHESQKNRYANLRINLTSKCVIILKLVPNVLLFQITYYIKIWLSVHLSLIYLYPHLYDVLNIGISVPITSIGRQMIYQENVFIIQMRWRYSFHAQSW